jgi:hypothetical protein
MCPTRHFPFGLGRLKKKTRQIINAGNMIPHPRDYLWRNNLAHDRDTATVWVPQTAISIEIAVFAVVPALPAKYRNCGFCGSWR